MHENNINSNTPELSTNLKKKKHYTIIKLVGIFLIVVLVSADIIRRIEKTPNQGNGDGGSAFGSLLPIGTFEMQKFTSEEEFKNYLSKSSFDETDFGYDRAITDDVVFSPEAMEIQPMVFTGMGSKSLDTVSRVSTTNVQVTGIDEPDIVKLDEKSIFASFQSTYRGVISRPILMVEDIGTDSVAPYEGNSQETKIIKSFPPSEIEKIGGIDKIGNLLLIDDTLVIFSDKVIYGYDVSNRASPKETWNIPYEDKTYYKAARLYNNEIFLITSTYINSTNPCPYYPIKYEGESYGIACTDIYYPKVTVQARSTYTVLKIDAKTGKINDKVSFLGESSNSVVYMSENNLYLTYSFQTDFVSTFSQFIKEDASDLFPKEINERLEKLASYDLSNSTKMMEMFQILEEYLAGLSSDEELRITNEIENRMDIFSEKHVREFETTGIVKVSTTGLNINSTGAVPGHPLNQFSLDEYKNNLRIATNSGSTTMFSTTGDVNDVYVLDSELNVIGVVKDLGKDERIYSARFIGDRGYVVTFREIDPFYVLDLSNPNKPEMKGELKIPGFSSYLHPISDRIILGIGREDSKVKISMFDVSNAENPTEVDKYLLDEYWTEVSDNHHAFLMDSKHSVFFMPGSKGGYIFSYEGDKLKLVRAVSSVGVKRAVYLNDYMYVIGDEGIVVLDENSWEEVKNYQF